MESALHLGCGSFRERWHRIAEELRKLIPAAGLSVLSFPLDVLTSYPESNEVLVQFRCRDDPDVSRRFTWNFKGLDEYVARYAARDPSAAALIRGCGEPIRLSQLVDETDRDHNAFTGEFLPHWNLRHVLSAVPVIHDSARISITLFRADDEPDFTLREEGMLRALIPFLTRASKAALIDERLARAPERSDRSGLLFLSEGGLVDPAPLSAIQSALPKSLSLGELLLDGQRRMRESERRVSTQLELTDGRLVELCFDQAPGSTQGVVSFAVFEPGKEGRFDAAARKAGLSEREREVSLLVGQGLGNKGIAYELGIGRDTVKEYLSRAFEKTGTDGRAALMVYLYGC